MTETKKGIGKKILSFLLSICMVIPMIAMTFTSAFAGSPYILNKEWAEIKRGIMTEHGNYAFNTKQDNLYDCSGFVAKCMANYYGLGNPRGLDTVPIMDWLNSNCNNKVASGIAINSVDGVADFTFHEGDILVSGSHAIIVTTGGRGGNAKITHVFNEKYNNGAGDRSWALASSTANAVFKDMSLERWAMYGGDKTGRFDVFRFTFVTEVPTWAKVKKVSKDNEWVSGYSIAGAKYGVYNTYSDAENNRNRLDTLVTDGNGNTGSFKTKVKKGSTKTVYIKEYEAPPYYKIDNNVYPVVLKPNETTYITSTDYLKRGRIELKKEIAKEKELVKLCPENYSLEGAEYGVYGNLNEAVKEGYRYGTLRTDKKGKTNVIDNLVAGSYYVKETKAPKGYKLDRSNYGYGLNGIKKVEVYADKTSSIIMKDEPEFDPMRFVLKKTVEKGADKNLSTAGAKYTVKYYKSFLYNKEDVKNAGKPFRTWTFETKESSDGTYSRFLYDDEYKIDRSELFKTSTQKPIGMIGTYVFEEVEAPKGFAKTDGIVAIRRFNPEKKEYVGQINDVAEPLEINTEEKEQKANIEVQKVDAETGKNKAQGNYGGTLQGAIYDVFYFDPLELKDVFVGSITTDKNGYGVLENLKIGYYKVKEKVASTGYLLEEKTHSIFARITEKNTPVFVYTAKSEETPISLSVGKITIDETGVSTVLEGVELELRKGGKDGKILETWTTGKGKHTFKALPVGKYTITEKKTPEGYLKLEEPYTFEIGKDGYAKKTNRNVSLNPNNEVVKGKKGNTEIKITNERIPEIQTEAVFSENTKSSLPKEKVTVIDTVTYKGLLKGHEYTFKGEIVNIENGKVITKGSTTFTPDKANGTIKVRYDFNAKDLEGTTMVVTEKLYRNDRIGNKQVAKHVDLADDKQTVSVIKLRTKAVDKVDNGKDMFADEKQTVVDTVTYEDCIVGKEYTVNGTLMCKETGKPILDNGKKVTASKTFTAEKKDGFVKLEFTLNASALKGKTIVAFEEMKEDKITVAVHKDINDIPQSVYVPEVGTTATDKTDNDKDMFAKETQTVVDTVKYENLLVGETYTFKGILMDKDSAKPLLVNGKEVIASKTFTPSKPNGTVNIEFTFDASELKGKSLVVYETLFRGNKQVAEHVDINDIGQTVKLPEIGTTATDKSDNDKDMFANETQTIIDTVQYDNLIVGRTYTVKGILMDKDTNAPLLIDGKEVTTEKTFVAEKETASIDMEFTFNADSLAGKTIVVFENLYRDNKQVAEHKDINDEGQTVKVPKIETSAFDIKDNGKDLFADEEQTIVDTVTYKNLIIGRTYTVKGILMDSETGKPILVDGKEVTAEKTFVAEKTDATIDIEFVINASTLQGKTIVAFEELYRDNKKVAVHTDITDEEQTIYVPEIGTTATATDDGGKNVLPLEKVSITDEVKIGNLIIGQKYQVKAELIDKETGDVLDTTELCFKATEKEMILSVDFLIDTRNLKNGNTVAFETIYKLDDEGNIGKVIAEHKDINDEGQTVRVVNPEVGTTAKWNDGTKKATVDKSMTIIDTVTYKDLVIGKEYTIKGILMNKEIGKPFIVNGKEVTAEKTFVAEKTEGTIELEFTFDGSEIDKDTDIVVFEELFYDEQLIAEHKDINDEGQTVKAVPEGKITMEFDGGKRHGDVKTGDNTKLLPIMMMAILSLTGLTYVSKKKEISK